MMRQRDFALAVTALAVVAGVLVLFFPRLQSEAEERESSLAVRPTKVGTGLYVLNVGRLDTLTGSFTADFFLSFKCEQPCEPGNFEITNGRATFIDKQDDEPTEKLYRIQASLSTDVSLRSYPFDRHKLLIALEDKQLTEEELVHEVDPRLNGIDSRVIVSGWELVGWDARVSSHYYPVFDQTYSRYEFFIEIRRGILSAVLKGMLPALVIVLAGFLGFLLGPDRSLQRLTINTGALTGAILFHINLTSQVPPVGSLTYADKFMIVNYFGLVAALVATVAIVILSDRKQDAAALQIHRLSRLYIPPLWGLTQIGLTWTLF